MLLIFLILSHEPTSPFTLPGSRPPLPPMPALDVKVRLGHRVGPKVGRKLSAVTESGEDEIPLEFVAEFEAELEQPQQSHGVVTRSRSLSTINCESISEELDVESRDLDFAVEARLITAAC